jgi:hypothetical protein
MRFAGRVGNADANMSAMQKLMHKKMAPLEGRAEPQGCENKFSQGGNAAGAREEEKQPAVLGVI